jgi:hypothetical protein
MRPYPKASSPNVLFYLRIEQPETHIDTQTPSKASISLESALLMQRIMSVIKHRARLRAPIGPAKYHVIQSRH